MQSVYAAVSRKDEGHQHFDQNAGAAVKAKIGGGGESNGRGAASRERKGTGAVESALDASSNCWRPPYSSRNTNNFVLPHQCYFWHFIIKKCKHSTSPWIVCIWFDVFRRNNHFKWTRLWVLSGNKIKLIWLDIYPLATYITSSYGSGGKFPKLCHSHFNLTEELVIVFGAR